MSKNDIRKYSNKKGGLKPQQERKTASYFKQDEIMQAMNGEVIEKTATAFNAETEVESGYEKIGKWLRRNTRLGAKDSEILISFDPKFSNFNVNVFSLGGFEDQDKSFSGKSINEALSNAFNTCVNLNLSDLENLLKEKKFCIKIEYFDMLYRDGRYVSALFTDDYDENLVVSASSVDGVKESLERLTNKVVVKENPPVQEDDQDDMIEIDDLFQGN